MSRRRDRSLRHLFGPSQVPEHRPGFWEDVEQAMEAAGPGDEAGGDELPEVVALDRAGALGRPSPWAAASAAAAVVLLLGAATAVLMRPWSGDEVAGEPVDTAVVAVAETLSGTSTGSATTDPAGFIAPPWASSRVRQQEAPVVLVDEWQAADNQRWCSALTPTTLGVTDAVPRAATFDGGWGVAWDRRAGPGQYADGTDCPECGRSAFGIAGLGLPHDVDTAVSRPTTIRWSDGSVAGWDPAAAPQRDLAEMVVAEQGCVYEVWSNLGEDHLRRFIDGLRLVEGLEAAPVTLRRAEDQPVTEQRGAPPWQTAGVSFVDDLVLAQLEALGVGEPRVVLADLGDGMGEAAIRTWRHGVAWDLPDGPGHDAENRPCADCGRGVVGFGWVAEEPPAADRVAPPHRIEWADGSYAEYGGRLSPAAVPRDRIRFHDPVSGEPTVDALRAVVHVAGASHTVEVWTHLGEAHLLYLLGQLQVVQD